MVSIRSARPGGPQDRQYAAKAAVCRTLGCEGPARSGRMGLV